MKKILLLLSALFIATTAFAQSAREELDAHPHLAIPTHSVYAGAYYFRPIADAPKGYKPFYISHYGRHGSRHESNEKYPNGTLELLKEADSHNLLTAKGKEVLAEMHKICKAHEGRIGELTRLGFEQHKGIARRMYRRFKPVFHHGAIVESRSSDYTRCILSMAAFNESLKECNKMLETRMDAAKQHTEIVRPTMPFIKDPRYNGKVIVSDEAWWLRLLEWADKQNLDHCTNAIFTDVDKACKVLNRSKMIIMRDIYMRLAIMQNLGQNDRTLIDSIFSADERYAIYLFENYRWYCRYMSLNVEGGKQRFAPMQNTVKDIIKYADLAIEGKNSAVANLRFGHDYYLLGLMTMIGFNECSGDADISSVEKLGESWPSFKVVTMGSNLQFVFYRSKKNPDILVRILENENDVTLPIESATAPFYKWEDVKSYLNARIAEFNK